MVNPDDAMCIDYRFLGSYSLYPEVAEAYDNAPVEKRAVLNRLEHLYHVEDDEVFVRKALRIQDMLGDAGVKSYPISKEEMCRDKGGTVGILEGYAAQMVMGREEAKRAMFPNE